jgi:hypothetical protein
MDFVVQIVQSPDLRIQQNTLIGDIERLLCSLGNPFLPNTDFNGFLTRAIVCNTNDPTSLHRISSKTWSNIKQNIRFGSLLDVVSEK